MNIAEMTVESLSSEMWGIWFLIGAAFVFWMQAGFAMVESGFTRAKNAGNIIMKNLMDFCIGTVMWFLIGASLMMAASDGSKDIMGIIGTPGFGVFTDYQNFSYSGFVFNLMFCATTATIVSGAVAERTKFLSYIIYSAVISGLIYPVEAHWTWGGGFLYEMGFHDYAGSNCIHMVGGICALIGAAFVGPRIGKFKKDKDGRITKVNAIPGHNLVIGALGVFILWLGWYGFNGAAATDIPTLGSVFLTTTVAPAVAAVVTMTFTWIKYGKPDVSMTLNAALAGLVAITAPCDVADCAGAAVIGLVSGFLVVFGVWFLDYKLHIDDPVGAVPVHLLNGIWGTIAVGLFATSSAPGFELAGIKEGLFYGGGFTQLGLQLAGMLITAAWAVVTITIVFFVLKKTIGIRATAEEEIAGMDAAEHGLESAYADFVPAPAAGGMVAAVNTIDHEAAVTRDVAVPVIGDVEAAEKGSMSKVSILCKQAKFEELKAALNTIGVMGITVTQVLGCGVQKGSMAKYYRGVEVGMVLLPKIKVEVVVSKVPVRNVIDAAIKALYTGNIGDGKIFVYHVENAVKVRTGEQGYDALQGTAEDYF